MPGRKRAEVLVHHEHQRRVGVLQDAVDDDVVAGPGPRPAARLRRLERERARSGSAGSRCEVPHPHRRRTARRRPTTARWVSTDTSLTPSAESAPHRAARGGAEADHRGAQRGGRSRRWSPAAGARAGPSSSPPARCSCGRRARTKSPLSLQWFIASQAMRVSRRSMASWAISRSCTQCGQPQTTWPGRSVSRSSASGLGSRSTSHCGEELLARAQPADQRRELLVGGPELIAVAVLEEHARAQAGVDALEVRGMDRLPALVGLARRRDDAEGQVGPRDESMSGLRRFAAFNCIIEGRESPAAPGRARSAGAVLSFRPTCRRTTSASARRPALFPSVML